jgi:hypothetical protein
MVEEKLTKCIKAGYPHIKEGAGLEPWVLPEYGLNRIVDEVGDSGILKVSEPLGLNSGVERLLETVPDPASISPETWQRAVRKWQPLSNVAPVIAAFLGVAGVVMAQLARIKPIIDPAVICRSLAVLLLSPFIEQGKALLAEVAGIMGRENIPAELILGYGGAVARRDVTTLEKINRCILKYKSWQAWASAIEQQVNKCRYTPKLIAVTPPPSAELVAVLAVLMKEGHDESRGDNPGNPGEPVAAQ